MNSKIERNLNCPLASAAYDLEQTEKELTHVYDCIAAVKLLTATDSVSADCYSISIQEAAQILADMDPTMVEGNTTAEVLDRLYSWADGIREERDSFSKACDYLRLLSRVEAIKLIESELELADLQTSDDPKIKYFYDGQRAAYEKVLEALNTFKYEE